jgi:hypothetical protein
MLVFTPRDVDVLMGGLMLLAAACWACAGLNEHAVGATGYYRGERAVPV